LVFSPFEGILDTNPKIVDINSCEMTIGAECLGARLAKVLAGATFIYGHVHKPFEVERLTKSARCWDAALSFPTAGIGG